MSRTGKMRTIEEKEESRTSRRDGVFFIQRLLKKESRRRNREREREKRMREQKRKKDKNRRKEKSREVLSSKL